MANAVPPHRRALVAAALLTGLVSSLSSCADQDRRLTGPTSEPEPGAVAQASAPAVFFQMSAGLDHTCAVTPDHRAFCWGGNTSGQLGDGTNRPHLTPVGVSGGLEFRQVTAGAFNSCGVTTEDVAYCWGTNGDGPLGDGTRTMRSTPVPVAGGHRFRRVESNGLHSCGVTDPDNLAYCWGLNDDGQLGDGTRTTRLRPVLVSSTLHWRQVTVGFVHTCGVTIDFHAYCWGKNTNGELGDGTTTTRFTPVAVVGGLDFGQLTAGASFTCGKTLTNEAYCWGGNPAGSLGNGTVGNSSHTPTPVSPP